MLILLWIILSIVGVAAFLTILTLQVGFERVLMALLPYFEITKVVNGEKVVYLRRFFLWRNHHGRSIYLHHILRSDDDPDPHDHPFDFTSIILRGGYFDQEWGFVPPSVDGGPGIRYQKEGTPVFPGEIVRRPASHIHRVILFSKDFGWDANGSFVSGPPTPAWTLVITGPHFRHWGFIKEDRWVYWREYLGLGPDEEYKVD